MRSDATFPLLFCVQALLGLLLEKEHVFKNGLGWRAKDIFIVKKKGPRNHELRYVSQYRAMLSHELIV